MSKPKTSADVLPFVRKSSYRDDAIMMLEAMIARVRSGDVVAVAVLGATSERGLTQAWAGWSGDLISPAAILSQRLVKDVLE